MNSSLQTAIGHLIATLEAYGDLPNEKLAIIAGSVSSGLSVGVTWGDLRILLLEVARTNYDVMPEFSQAAKGPKQR